MEPNGEKDIFDRLMTLPLLRRFQPFFAAHREGLLYLFFGGLTTVVGIGSYAVFAEVFAINELVANFFSWIIAVAFAFVTNQKWVFRDGAGGSEGLGRRIAAFYAGRVATLLVEEAILAMFVTILGLPGILVKTAAQVVVVLLNYIISKLFVFKKR